MKGDLTMTSRNRRRRSRFELHQIGVHVALEHGACTDQPTEGRARKPTGEHILARHVEILDACVTAQQVFGGHGYVKEWGMEQLVRDVRIAQIYEGTNQIQRIVMARNLPNG